MTADLGFVHRWVPATRAGAPTLLLLHGTGGTEEDLLPLGELLAPGAAMLSPRGQVLERGAPRFFRRLAEGVFDVPDLKARAGDLARFVERAATEYGFTHGANIASAAMLLHPGLVQGAVLFRGMLPFEAEPSDALAGTRVLLSNGRRDPIVPRDNVERLAETLRAAGGDVTLEWQDSGHELTQGAVAGAREWHAGVAAK